MSYSYRLVHTFSRRFKQRICPGGYSRRFKIDLDGKIFWIVSLDLGFLKIIQLRAIQYQPTHVHVTVLFNSIGSVLVYILNSGPFIVNEGCIEPHVELTFVISSGNRLLLERK